MNINTPADHPIHVAAAAGRLREVCALLDADPTLLERGDLFGGTPLHHAVIGRSQRMVSVLLDRGADIHAQFGADRLLDRGATYDLTIAAALGDLSYVRTALDEDPTRIRYARPNLRRPLSAAVEFRHDAIVRLLLERGADPTWPDADYSERGAALHIAAHQGNREIVELLLAHGADPNGFVDSAGNAVFASKTPEIRTLLMQHGGTLDPYDHVWLDEDDEVMRRVTTDPQSAHAGCGGVYTAVVTKAKRGLLQRLLDAGVKVPKTPNGCRNYLLEQPDMLKQLLERGGLDPDYTDENGSTLLHALCVRDPRGSEPYRRVECATLLLNAGATLSPRDKDGITPLACAIRNTLPDMVEFLRSRGARDSSE